MPGKFLDLQKFSFTAKGTPIAQPRHSVGKGRAYIKSSHAIHTWKQAVFYAAKLSRPDGWRVADGAMYASILFVMPRPLSMVWKKKPMPREWHTGTPDADNLAKAVKDALKGVVWIDDSQVCDMQVKKVIAGGYEEPHAHVTIMEIAEYA